jgi:hypothetical protein
VWASSPIIREEMSAIQKIVAYMVPVSFLDVPVEMLLHYQTTQMLQANLHFHLLVIRQHTRIFIDLAQTAEHR